MSHRQSHLDLDRLPLGLAPRTLFVTGKGGVGKSTVTAALALAYRDAGARTLIVEIEGQASAAQLISDRKIGYQPTPLSEHLSALRITLTDALKEYARLRLKVKLVADRLVSNPIIDQFTHAAPGFRDLLVLGKLWQLSTAKDDHGRPVWDAIIVDSPATGHGLGLLNMAGVIARMFPVGPIAGEARAVDEFTRDSSASGVVLVTLPEELPVSETFELHDRLVEQRIPVVATIINGLLVDRFSAGEMKAVKRLLVTDNDSNTIEKGALTTALLEHERCLDQAKERERLEASIPGLVALLPYMFASELEREHVTVLSQWLMTNAQNQLHLQLAGAEDGPAVAAALHERSSV